MKTPIIHLHIQQLIGQVEIKVDHESANIDLHQLRDSLTENLEKCCLEAIDNALQQVQQVEKEKDQRERRCKLLSFRKHHRGKQ